MDTSLEIHRERIRLLRLKSPEWKFQKTMELCDGLKKLVEQARKSSAQ